MTYFDEDVRSLSDGDYLLQAHSDMERKLGTSLPESFPLSLSLLDFNIKNRRILLGLSDLFGHTGQELILPENPQEEAAYWLNFPPFRPHKLRYSLLARVTDRPQVMLGINNHGHIGEIINELRAAYDGREIIRTKRRFQVPLRSRYKLPPSFSRRILPFTFDVIYPKNGINLARDFEEILDSHSAIEQLLEKGFEKVWEAEQEIGLVELL